MSYSEPNVCVYFQMRVELHTFVSLRNPDIFPEPDLFKPERWLKGGSAEHVHPFIVLPFSHGPRMCIGTRIATRNNTSCVNNIWSYYKGKKRSVLFNDILNTFYLRLYGVRHMVKDHSDSERAISRSNQCSTTGVTKVVVCSILSLGWCI